MRRQRSKIRRRPVPRNCHFCGDKRVPNYKEIEVLKRFVSDRGKILAHTRTGICSKHQRKLSREIKRARHIALLPFVV